MAKLKIKNLPIMGTVGGVAGGVAGLYAQDLIKSNDNPDSFLNNGYVKAGILAAVGVGAQVFVKNDLVAGIGNGMAAVAGILLAKELITNAPSIAALPSQRAIAALPSQRAIGSPKWIDVKEVKVPSKAAKTKNVQ